MDAAVLNHIPLYAIGSRQVKSFELWLQRYDVRRPRRPPGPPPTRFLTTQKPRAPVIRYQLLTPTDPVGPLDIVTIPLILHPDDPAVVVRGISLIVERRIELSETSSIPSPIPGPRPILANPLVANEEEDSSNSTIRGNNHDRRDIESSSTVKLLGDSSSTFRLTDSSLPVSDLPMASTSTLSSAYTMDSFGSSLDQRPLLQPVTNDLPAKTTTLTVAAVESPGPFVKDSSGIYSKSLTLQWPAAKSGSHWAMGETMQTDMINVRFFTRVKVCIFVLMKFNQF